MQAKASQITTGLYIIMGDEPLLVLEAIDGLRLTAKQAGYCDREVFHADARSDWNAIMTSLQSFSLFGDKKLIELRLPSGKPGKTGADTLVKMAQNQASQTESVLIIQLPKLDKTTRNSAWFKALSTKGTVTEIASIERTHLSRWIAQRLQQQGQQTDQDTLQWIAERVEGNLLAAHQEILKLDLLFPQGHLSHKDVQEAVMSVARYDVFQLRDAMLAGDAKRMTRMLDGLKAEGESVVLALWSIGETVRALSCMARTKAQRQNYQTMFRQYRFFGQTERLAQQALERIPLAKWQKAVQHAHDIDKLIKGLPAPKRTPDPWFELGQLALFICYP